jgi:hypothetical protein
MSDDSVIVKFGGSIEGLTEAIDGAKEAIEGLATPFTGLQESFAGIGEAIAAALAVDKAKEFAESMAELGTKTSRGAQILGVSTEEVGAIDLIAKATGTSLEALELTFGKLAKNVVDESDETKRALQALGLSFADIGTKQPVEQLELLAQKFSEIKDGTEKDAIGAALFGRTFEQILPLLNQGAQGIQKWENAAKELGVALSSETVESMEEMHAALVEMNGAFTGASIQAFLGLKGALMGAVQASVISRLPSPMRRVKAAGQKLPSSWLI